MKDFLFAVTVVLGIMLVGVFVYPNPEKTHADFSDKEEASYCRAWLNGAKVTGGTEDEIRKHCAEYLK